MLISVSPCMLLAGLGSWMFGLVFMAFMVFALACRLWLLFHKLGLSLRAGNNMDVDVPREGRNAHIRHKNSFSESDFKGVNLGRPKRKRLKEEDPGTVLPKREVNDKKREFPSIQCLRSLRAWIGLRRN